MRFAHFMLKFPLSGLFRRARCIPLWPANCDIVAENRPTHSQSLHLSSDFILRTFIPLERLCQPTKFKSRVVDEATSTLSLPLGVVWPAILPCISEFPPCNQSRPPPFDMLRASPSALARLGAPQRRAAALRAFSSLPSWATVDPVKLSGAHPAEGFNLGEAFLLR